jgi:hypothetical protein
VYTFSFLKVLFLVVSDFVLVAYSLTQKILILSQAPPVLHDQLIPAPHSHGNPDPARETELHQLG